MAVIAEELTTSPYVLSPWNLNGFLKWAGRADEGELDEVFQVVYMVEHRYHDVLFGTAAPGPEIINRPDLGWTYTIRQVQCEESNCQRCDSSRGGWQFRWIGPWTCAAIVGDENTDPRQLMLNASDCRCGRH